MIKPMIPGILCVMICARIVPAAEGPDSAIFRDFEKRVSAYIQLRQSIESSLPPLKSTRSPEKISSEEHELARAIRDARKNARPGDILTPEISTEIRQVIQGEMQSAGKRIEASLHHAEPVQLRLRVNDAYPPDVPLQSTPPSLLTNLPPLPKEVEYRVAGHDLILLDAKANLVVDLIENVIP
ncbi:MAG: hypothetical protein ABSG41_14265 [Bryobacteraceae bacterium]|jgi:hypothetical protein